MNSRSLPGFTNEGRISGGPPKQQEDNMLSLTGKTMVVIGGSRGVGRQIVEAGIRNGARVLAVARGEGRLARLPGRFRARDSVARRDRRAAPAKVVRRAQARLSSLSPPARFRPPHPSWQNWHEFAVNWESDVKIAFQFPESGAVRRHSLRGARSS